MSWLAISYETKENPKWTQLVPIEVDKRLTDPVKIKADLANKTAKRADNAAHSALLGEFVGGMTQSDKGKAVTLEKASDTFDQFGKYEHIMVFDPSLYLRLGVMDVMEGRIKTMPAGLSIVLEELRFGLMEGRCVEPGRLLFGTASEPLLLAQRFGLSADATLLESTSLAERLKARLNVLHFIGERIWG
jgi:hypothetical protein